MDRDARVQVSRASLNELSEKRHLEAGSALGAGAVYNVWHKKWSGGALGAKQFRSPFKCNVAHDSGVTRSVGPYFCLWFARGCCYKGFTCSFLHRIPNQYDALELNEANVSDCFGRTKFAEAREDRSGIGSFLKPCRTLFVGHFSGPHKSRERHIEQLRQHFSEWGSVTSVRVSKSMTTAFITYEYQCNAEFAKEAMSNQTITGKETLSVRWAEESKRDGKMPESGLNEKLIRKIVRDTLKNRGPNGIDGNALPPKISPRESNEPRIRQKNSTESEEPPLNQVLPTKKRRVLVDYD